MITVDDLLLNTICLFFPISMYLNYSTYMKSLEMKEKTIILEFFILTSFVLLLRFNASPSIYLFTIYSIPILMALYNKHNLLYFIMTLLIIIYSANTLEFNPYILPIKYILYFFIQQLLNKLNSKKELFFYITIEIIFLLAVTSPIALGEITIILQTIIIFIIYNIIMFIFLKKGSQTIELARLLKELEHEKLLRSSISKLTHELKNPIAVCQGYLEMLDLRNKEKSTKYIKIISSEIKRSKTIIDEFSSYGKLKKLDIEEMDICYLLEDIHELLLPLFKKNKATLIIPKTEDEIYINGDYNRLKQVFINLLKNSLEAKVKNRNLYVELKIKKTKTKVTIKVIDNGIGMTEETLARISEIFFTTKSNGTGLGLAYSKEVIELHKGTLKIDSKYNEGTQTTITIPKEKKSEDFNNKNY